MPGSSIAAGGASVTGVAQLKQNLACGGSSALQAGHRRAKGAAQIMQNLA
jgi:hypothetical protein